MSVYHALNLDVSPQQFRKIAESRDFFKSFKGSLGFGFIRKVNSKDIPHYIKTQTNYRSDFKLKRLEPRLLRPADSNMFVIEVVEPYEINKKAVGLVVSDELHRYKSGPSISTHRATYNYKIDPTCSSP